jgi:hypothetical protein
MIGLIFDCHDKVQNSAEIGAAAETGSRSRQYVPAPSLPRM